MLFTFAVEKICLGLVSMAKWWLVDLAFHLLTGSPFKQIFIDSVRNGTLVTYYLCYGL